MRRGLRIPFALRRPFLLFQGVRATRHDPPIDRLREISDPEQFVWSILPYAARTFAACIALLPEQRALASAVGYLYCRILDTFEDLSPSLPEKLRAIQAFSERFGGDDLPSGGLAPTLSSLLKPRTSEDSANMLLLLRVDCVDQVFGTLPQADQQAIRALVRDMARDMASSAKLFDLQGGVLISEAQVSDYCFGVIGHPLLFSLSLHERNFGRGDGVAASAVRGSAEFLQLANITRDLLPDLSRGVAYHGDLRPYLGMEVAPGSGAEEVVRSVRTHLCLRALANAPEYGRLVKGLRFRRWSRDRSAAILMLRFTERYWRGCAARVGVQDLGTRAPLSSLLRQAFLAFVSRAYANRVLSAALARMAQLKDRVQSCAMAPLTGEKGTVGMAQVEHVASARVKDSRHLGQ